MVNSDLLLVIKSSVLGDAKPDLGEKLMQSFLAQLLGLGQIPARIICLGTGVSLTTTEGSQTLDLIRRFDAAGSEVFSCGTCLEYYGRKINCWSGTSEIWRIPFARCSNLAGLSKCSRKYFQP